MENIENGLLLSYIGYKLKTPLQNTIGSVIFLKKLLKSQSTQCIAGTPRTSEYHSTAKPSTSEHYLAESVSEKISCG